jgi:predicted phosphoribosyltransferase
MALTMTNPPFADRTVAGRLLAQELAPLADHHPVVYGLPRCGVPVAYEVAQHLGAPLDVALVRTVRASGEPERLLATVLEGQPPTIRMESDAGLPRDWPRDWLDAALEEAVDEIAKRLALYRGRGRPFSPSGRTAIVVDQTVTSGHAAAGAIRLLRDAGARSVVVATPVAGAAGLARLAPLADRVVTLRRVSEVGPLADHYGDWRQVSHHEALSCLERARE